MRTNEVKLKMQVKAYLTERGAYWNMPVPMGYGVPMLDFVGCYKGAFFAIETKAEGRKPTARQALTIKQMQAAGGWVVWDWDWDCLRLKLETFFNTVDEGLPR